jgi:diketogulonate reductase-like aldo/keto reductase
VVQALRDSGLDRGEVFVTTKLPPGNAARARATLAESLRALGTDYVDLWLIHWLPRRSASVPLWRHGVTPAQVVLRWHLEQGITVIPKSAHPTASSPTST